MGPWSAAWRRLRRNRVAMASLAVLVAIVACCLAAPLWADQVAHVGPDENNLTGTFERGGKRLYVVTPPPQTKPVGPGLERALPARRRQQRPRRDGAAALRRAQLAVHRVRVGAHHHGHRGGPRPGRRLFPRPHRPRRAHGVRRDLVLPRAAARHRAGHGACRRRAAPGPDRHPGRLAVDPDSGDRDHLHPVSRAPDPRAGAVAAREGVRRGRGGPGQGAAADHVRGAAAQPRVDDPRVRHADRGQQHPHRGGALVPRRRGAARRRRRGGT